MLSVSVSRFSDVGVYVCVYVVVCGVLCQKQNIRQPQHRSADTGWVESDERKRAHAKPTWAFIRSKCMRAGAPNLVGCSSLLL